MKAIWKEFFRLKREEIGDFFGEYGEIIYFIPLGLWAINLIFVIVPVSMIWNDTVADRYFLITTAIMLLVYLIILTIVVAKWLQSNWQQAKKNVRNK